MEENFQCKILRLVIIFSSLHRSNASPVGLYEISDDLGLGRRFDGIGGISGGGATSKLLVNYPEAQRNDILDYLFKPNFGASLQILKVEIGGGDASVGSEASHMREMWDENYDRGYEWWIMKEAKKRNPDIKLFGLSWSWPGWLGADLKHPYKNLTNTAMYTVKWIRGAKTHHNLTIDYIGIWNEQWCNPEYILFLSKSLHQEGLDHVKIIGCDDWLENFFPLMKNKSVADATYAFGVHYPGTIISKEALDTNLTIWASEDYSTFNDDVGAGCWARILNQNYVTGYMTSTISWNLIASYYPGLPFEYESLMTAVEPWSGHYRVNNPIWISAHTTQFTQIGYNYLLHERGVGMLDSNGSYVSFVSPDNRNLTIVIETMTHDHSICIRPELPPYTVERQKAIFKFGGSFVNLQALHLWRTTFNFHTPEQSVIFRYEGKVEIVSNRLAIELETDSVYTLTTSDGGSKGDYGEAPKSKPFPVPYMDDFEGYHPGQEPYLLSPQVGSWEIIKDDRDGNQFARQMVQSPTVAWCMKDVARYPAAIIGDTKWRDTNLTVRVRVPNVNGTCQVFVAVRFSPGGCEMSKATGLFLWLTPKSGGFVITTDYAGLNAIDVGVLPEGMRFDTDTWWNVSVVVKSDKFSASFNGRTISEQTMTDESIKDKSGWAALGTGGWGLADFDDLRITQ